MRRSPKETAESNRRISRRALFLGGAQLAFAAGLGARMRYLQVEQADEFRVLADENRIKDRVIAPVRGRIFDRNGLIIANNEPTYRVSIVREEAGDVEDAITKLSSLLELEEDDVNRAIAEMKVTPAYLPVTLADRISWEEFSRVNANAPSLPGVQPEQGLSRIYPMHDIYAHVAGYVSKVSARDLDRYEDPPAVLKIPRFQFGKVGVEALYENELRGSAGTRRVEVNSSGREMRELGRREGASGADIQLSSDSALQDYLQARLGDESASAIVMDVRNGDVLAIASAPSYDPNKFVRGISIPDYAFLRENDHRPLASKAVQDAFPPGSTFKMLTALAGLESGDIRAGDTAYCPGYLEISGRRFGCWKRGGHGSMDLVGSLRESCDVYYYELAQKVGIENIAAMARRFGLGSRPDIPMSAVSSGLIPDKAWKKERHNEDWLVGDSANAAIGQGFVLASPLQLAIMASRIATGRAVTPRLVKSIDGVETPSQGGEDLGITPAHMDLVRQGMYEVSNYRKGSAYRARIIADGYRLAGKTGTAQVVNRLTKCTDPWDVRDHAFFVCFAPYDDPKIAVAVAVEHGCSGSGTAAPIARDIVLQALYGEEPPLEAYPAKDREAIEERQKDIRQKLRLRQEDRATRA